MTPSDLPGKPKSFKEYLEGIFENSSSMRAERLAIQKRCKSTVNFQDSQIRALVAASFPPVKVGQLAGSNVPVTYEGDKFPQFSQLQKSTFLCEVCIPFQKWATEHGRPHPRLRCRTQASLDAIVAGTATLKFSGLVQVGEHADSESHRHAIKFFGAIEDTSSTSSQLSQQESLGGKRKSSGQQSIQKFFRPLNEERPPDVFQQSKQGKVKCHHLWDPEVVKHFADDRQIRRLTAKSLFQRQVHLGEITCFLTMEGHEGCRDYKTWKEVHPVDAKDVIEKANNSFRSIYVPMRCTIDLFGQLVKIDGSIKSVDPPCIGEAVSHGENPYTCNNCSRQLRELKDVLRHREKGSLGSIRDRIGIRGFNQRYAKTLELQSALKTETRRRKEAEKNVMELSRVKLSRSEWERCLMDACLSCDEEKLIVDLIRLFKTGVSKTNPVQMTVIQNLTSKLSKRNNNHFVELIKDISGLFRNELGSTNYSLLADMFGLTGTTTASNHGKEERLDAGINHKVFEDAALRYKGLPVNEASDGARSLRYLQPRLSNSGEVVLLGKAWNPDVESWTNESITVPRRDSSKGDKDDYDALKRLVNKLLDDHQLAKNVSIHNFTALAPLDKPTLIYCLWPTVDKGYKASHLLRYWEKLRNLCYYTESGEVRQVPINLLTYSTDSAGFSLSAASKLMKPTKQEVKDGIVFLGLGVEGERFLAPYYWHLPAIACLDYDHEQRLFLKNLKYETRELTFWEEGGRITRLATIQHLHDLKNRCQNLGLDCGFNATDLLLVFFCDQNSDACERLFTTHIADLLDEHIPGSEATSLYIRAVCRLIEPFRRVYFGSPAEVQESVSSAIIILRLWKRVLELKKIPLHSKPGAKSDPSKRGKFLTNGCYTTAEILFAAATLYQLAMFLHFKELGPSAGSLYNTGTKSTERIISEMQGKTTEIQSLDAQPTFADMLDKSTRVQFNINTKQRLAQAGAKVRQSSNRRQRAFAFSKCALKEEGSYRYPSEYKAFLEEQRQAHFRGVKNGQVLFEKYMPAEAVELLKKSGYWEVPYRCDHPDGLRFMDGDLPDDYNMLDKTYAYAKGCVFDLEEDIENANEENEESDETKEEESKGNIDEGETEIDKFECEEEREGADKGSKAQKWKISKSVGGRTTTMHIKRALKLLLPREYIARCRQKRHWAAKYLPGKAPLDPKHDIVKFANVALKSSLKGQKVFDIARVEAIQSCKDGADVNSFRLKGDSSMRVRFSIYQQSATDDTYHVHPALGLTQWRASSSILGPVELIPVTENTPGSYKLHEASKKLLNEMGFICRGDVKLDETEAASYQTSLDEQQEDPLPDDFYEIEDVLQRRLCKDSLTYEYKVRFKGYQSDDDMWLPASYFNRAINYESMSRFGRKRKHKIDPDAARDIPNKKRRTCSEESKQRMKNRSSMSKESSLRKRKMQVQETKTVDCHKGKAGPSSSPAFQVSDKDTPESQNETSKSSESKPCLSPINKPELPSDSYDSLDQQSRKTPVIINEQDERPCQKKTKGSSDTISMENGDVNHKATPKRRKQVPSKARRNIRSKNKGKAFRSSLASILIHDINDSETFDFPSKSSKSNSCELASENSAMATETNETLLELLTVPSVEESAQAPKKGPATTKNVSKVINLDEIPSEEIPLEMGVMAEVLRRNDNFCFPRRLIGETKFPDVDRTVTSFSLSSSKCVLTDPLKVNKLPPQSVLLDIEKEFAESSNKESEKVVQISSYGNFNQHGILILQRFHRLKRLRAEVEFEKAWLRSVSHLSAFTDDVTHALLDRWNLEGTYLASYHGYTITSQVLSQLCGERYLSDEILNFLGQKYCDESNHNRQACHNILLPSFLSTGELFENVVVNICANYDLDSVKSMYLPVHINSNHWGLAIFSVIDQTVFFDDGYHSPIPDDLNRNAHEIIEIIHQVTSNDKFLPSKWFKIKRFRVPMPDQPDSASASSVGCGSCGVAVLCAIRDFCSGRTSGFSWSYKDAPRLRLELMLEILGLLT